MKSLKQWFNECMQQVMPKKPMLKPDVDADIRPDQKLSEMINVVITPDGNQNYGFYTAKGLIKDVKYDVYIDLDKLADYCIRHRAFSVDLCELLAGKITQSIILNPAHRSVNGEGMYRFNMGMVFIDPKRNARIGDHIFMTDVSVQVKNVSIAFTYGNPIGNKCMLEKPLQYQKRNPVQ